VLASLNHPNIAAIYGFEDSGATHALVMELVEGRDLSEIIAAGSEDPALHLRDAIAIARQIADALEAAHEQGIVHRDLKPANVKVRADGTVKVLDFGLAKAMDPSGGSNAEAMNSPTLTARATQMGMIIGTAAYMSPEQAKGKVVDKRTDIWAFGVVLYEMLTGARAFKGDDVSETLASVLKDTVDVAALPASVPPRLRALIARCLERDVKLRLRDIGEARVELAKIADGHPGGDHVSEPAAPAASVASRSSLLPWAVALVAVVVAAYFGWSALGKSSASTLSSQHLRLNIDPAESLLGSDPNEIRVGSRRPSRTAIAFSPDGQWLAFTGEQNGTQQLFLRDMRRESGVAVAGTAGADNPFFSPNGKSIGFWSNGALRKVPLDGGPVVEICKTARIVGADWGSDGRILFSAGDVIRIVSADGGADSAVTAIEAGSDEDGHRLPRWITADWFVYTATVGSASRLVAHRTGSADRHVLVEDATDGRVVAGGKYLVFMRDSTLMAAPFDAAQVQIAGGAQGVVEGVQVSLNAPNGSIRVGAGEFTVSDSGTLAYLPGDIFTDSGGTLTWLDRQGRTEPIDMESHGYLSPRLSPNGRQAFIGNAGLQPSLWIYDFDRHTTMKVAADVATDVQTTRAIWTPDGQALVVGGWRKQDRGLYRVTIGGSGVAEHLPGGVRNPVPTGWSHDGRELVYLESVRTIDGGTGTSDIFAVSLADKTIRPLVQTKGNDSFPAVSPDGQWLAYTSDESGPAEVLVQPYGGGARVTVSTHGGIASRWTRDGKTLIYSKVIVEPKSTHMEMWEVPLTITTTVLPGTPRKFADLAQADFGSGGPTANYDVAADGRLLGTTRRYLTPPPGKTLNVITNWFDELRAKAPVKK